MIGLSNYMMDVNGCISKYKVFFTIERSKVFELLESKFENACDILVLHIRLYHISRKALLSQSFAYIANKSI